MLVALSVDAACLNMRTSGFIGGHLVCAVTQRPLQVKWSVLQHEGVVCTNRKSSNVSFD